MANDVLKLTWAADGDVDEDTLNLLDFVQGLTLDDRGWTPQIAHGDQATVTETMTFHARALSHDQLAGYVQVLDDWIIKVGWSMDYTQRQFVWLNARWKSETEIRRAVVYSLAYSLGNDSSPFGPYLRDDSFVPTLTIVVTRGAYWESLDLVTLTHPIAADTLGGTITFIANAQPYNSIGDVPARISQFVITADGAYNLQYFWLGWRSSRNGVLANFEPLWELEDASVLSVDTAVVVDGTASGGSKLTCDFSFSTALSTRVGINTSDISGTPADQRGSFICLMRAKMSDASIARARADSGFVFGGVRNAVYYINPRVTVSGTSWDIYNLGVVRIPAINRTEATISVVEEAAIAIDAELVSGSGDLEMDCLVLVPYNDAYLEADSGDGANLYVMNNPDFTMTAFVLPGIRPSGVSGNGWGIPANNEVPLFVVGGARASSHVLTDAITIQAKIAQRWRTLRGAE